MPSTTEPEPNNTLPDLLRVGLGVVFIGINPSCYSVVKGHYFARPGNRFWPCFSLSALSATVRCALSVQQLRPEHDCELLAHGFGFTDLVKRPTVRASELTREDFNAGITELQLKLDRYQPRIACFHGKIGYRHVRRELEATTIKPALGMQQLLIGRTRCFVVPNPSGANAHFTPADQTNWYDRLAEFALQSHAA